MLLEEVASSLTIFDIDDTLFRTSNKVYVTVGEKRIRSLSPAEFNVYTLKQGEKFDFSEFMSAKHFYDTAKPVPTMFRIAKKIMGKLPSSSEFIIVTSRSDMDDRDLFIKTFHKYGFEVDRSHIYRAGNINAPGAEAKKKIIREKLKNKKYDVVRMFDDARKNLTSFMELSSEFPSVKFEAFLVDEEGKIKRI